MTRFGMLVFVVAVAAGVTAPFLLKPFGLYLISMWDVLTMRVRYRWRRVRLWALAHTQRRC
jgi:hypothetical protein